MVEEDESESPSSSLRRTILRLPVNISKSLKRRIGHKQSAKVRRKASVNLFQALTAMKKGLQVWKLPHKHILLGKAHMTILRLDSREEKFLYWYSHKNRSEVVVHLDQILYVRDGLPGDMRSWTNYSESLAFTVYFQTQSASYSPTSTSRSDPGTLANVTFVCKNYMEHKIWISVLEILLKVNNLHNTLSGTLAAKEKDKAVSFFLPTHMMTTEIEAIVRTMEKVNMDEINQSAAAVTPTGLKLSMRRDNPAILGEAAAPSNATDEDASVSKVSNADSNTLRYSDSTASFQLGDRTIADSWVWGRDMDKVRSLVADQVYPTLMHGQKTLDAYQIDCGEHHVVIIDEFGSVYTWGFSGPELGHGAPVEGYGPIQVKAFEGKIVTQVSCGTTTTIAITEKGETFLWGQPMYAFAKPIWYPKLLDTGRHRIKQVSCGAYHYAMCTLNGKVLTFGGGKFGALGHGSLTNCLKPKLVEALEIYFAEQVSCGIWHTAAVVKRKCDRRKEHPGELYAWGDNSVGQLGYQEPKTITLPIFVKGLKDTSVASVACGRHHTLALTEEGKLYSWGSNKYGQLGRILGPGDEAHVPGYVEEFSDHVVTQVAAGMDHNLVITHKRGQTFLYSWGRGDHGCLGHGDSKEVALPKHVQRLARKAIVSIACGANTSCAIVEHHFHKEIERPDKCKHCLKSVSGIRSQKKSCARCRVVYCKACVKQFGLLKPLLPLNTLPCESPLKESKFPNVCSECRDILVEAQLDAKHHTPRAGGGDNGGKKTNRGTGSKMVTVAPEARVSDLEKQLHEANEELRLLRQRLAVTEKGLTSSQDLPHL